MMTYFGIVLDEPGEALADLLVKRTMQVWLKSMESLLGMIVTKLPSPQATEKYRVNFGDGGESIRICGRGCRLFLTWAAAMPSDESSLASSGNYARCQRGLGRNGQAKVLAQA